MTINTSEPTINALCQRNPDLFTIGQKRGFMAFFPFTPLFSVVQLQEKH